MRLLILSVAGWLIAAGAAALAQSNSSSGVTQLPVGQVDRDIQFPFWEGGQLKYTLTATEAEGITVNRAKTTDLKIDIYTAGKVTTTITSPKADIYVADRKMRTNDTVKIVRADMTATAQSCNFDLAEKQYTLRNHVKVTLLHFDLNSSAGGRTTGKMGVTSAPPTPSVEATPPVPASATKEDSLLESPGSFSSTNNAPLPQ